MRRLLSLAFLPGAHIWAQGVSFERKATPSWGGDIIVAGDFNHDGTIDFVQVANSSLLTWLGNGDGSFRDPIRTDRTPVGIATAIAADFDGDGIPDVAAGSGLAASDPIIYLFRGDGRGGFVVLPPMRLPSSLGNRGLFITQTWVHSITAADFNRDGSIDLLVRTQEEDLFYPTSGPFHVLLGRGDGRFDSLPPFDDSYQGNTVVADVNHDGAPDIVVEPYGVPDWGVRPEYAEPYLLLGIGNGTFRPGPKLPVPFAEIQIGHTGLAAADLDRDGNIDVVLPVRGGLVVLLGAGDGQFRTASRIPVPNTIQIWTADVTGDGITDLLLRGPLDSILLLQGNGDGAFRGPVEIGASDNQLLAVSDLNGDGRADLVFRDLFYVNHTPASLAPTPIVSAAGVATAGVAPNMLISVYGTFLTDAARPDRTKVRLNGGELSLLYVSAGQINARVGPFPGSMGPARLQVESPAGVLEAQVKIVEYAPAIFTDQTSGEGMFQHSDGTLVTSRSPALVGEAITVLCTGLGRMGETPKVRIGDAQAVVRSSGEAPTGSLADTVEFLIPDVASSPGGKASVQLTIGGVGSNVVSIAVR